MGSFCNFMGCRVAPKPKAVNLSAALGWAGIDTERHARGAEQGRSLREAGAARGGREQTRVGGGGGIQNRTSGSFMVKNRKTEQMFPYVLLVVILMFSQYHYSVASNVSNSIKGLRRGGAAGAAAQARGGSPHPSAGRSLRHAEPAPSRGGARRAGAEHAGAEPARGRADPARGRGGARRGGARRGVGAPPSALSAVVYAIGLSH